MSRTTFLSRAWSLAGLAVYGWLAHAASAAETKSDAKPAQAASANSNVAASARPTLAPTLLPDTARAAGPGFDVASLEDRPQVGGALTLHLRERKAATAQGREAETTQG